MFHVEYNEYLETLKGAVSGKTVESHGLDLACDDVK
jgi:hypothetical protein